MNPPDDGKIFPWNTEENVSFFFFSPYSLFLRLNIEQQVRSLHKYLLRTWGGGKGLEPWPERGARGGSDRGTYRGDGGGGAGKEGNGARRGAGGGRRLPEPASRSFPIPTRLCYRLPGPTTGEILRAQSLPSPHFTDRETEAPGHCGET